MRLLLALLIFTTSGGANAQYPYNHAPYTPRDSLNGGQYVAPAQSRSSTPMSQAILDAHKVPDDLAIERKLRRQAEQKRDEATTRRQEAEERLREVLAVS